MGLKNGEYILTMKEKDKVIVGIDGSHKKPFISHYPNKEYKLIIRDNYCTLFDEEHKEGVDLLQVGKLDWFYIKKVA